MIINKIKQLVKYKSVFAIFFCFIFTACSDGTSNYSDINLIGIKSNITKRTTKVYKPLLQKDASGNWIFDDTHLYYTRVQTYDKNGFIIEDVRDIFDNNVILVKYQTNYENKIENGKLVSHQISYKSKMKDEDWKPNKYKDTVIVFWIDDYSNRAYVKNDKFNNSTYVKLSPQFHYEFYTETNTYKNAEGNTVNNVSLHYFNSNGIPMKKILLNDSSREVILISNHLFDKYENMVGYDEIDSTSGKIKRIFKIVLEK
jgi:hypothetical protein